MELTDELKKKLADQSTRNEAKSKLKDAGVILDDKELDSIAGGVGGVILRPQKKKYYWPWQKEFWTGE